MKSIGKESILKQHAYDQYDIVDREVYGLDLSCKNLSGMRFINCALYNTVFNAAQLHKASFINCDVNNCQFHNTYLDEALIDNCRFNCCDLPEAIGILSQVINTTFAKGSLAGSNFHFATFRDCEFSSTNLSEVNFGAANLINNSLSQCNITGANLSGVEGLPTAKQFLSQFDHDELGILVYRVCAERVFRYAPPHWKFAPGEFLTETCNPDRTTDCSSGVHFATLNWIKISVIPKSPDDVVWLCRIRWEDLADVTVPYNTNGKARCARLELLEPYDKLENL